MNKILLISLLQLFFFSKYKVKELTEMLYLSYHRTYLCKILVKKLCELFLVKKIKLETTLSNTDMN